MSESVVRKDQLIQELLDLSGLVTRATMAANMGAYEGVAEILGKAVKPQLAACESKVKLVQAGNLVDVQPTLLAIDAPADELDATDTGVAELPDEEVTEETMLAYIRECACPVSTTSIMERFGIDDVDAIDLLNRLAETDRVASDADADTWEVIEPAPGDEQPELPETDDGNPFREATPSDVLAELSRGQSKDLMDLCVALAAPAELIEAHLAQLVADQDAMVVVDGDKPPRWIAAVPAKSAGA